MDLLPTISMYSFIAYCFFTHFVICLAKTQEEARASYDGAQVWRTDIRGDQDFPFIYKLVEDQVISLWNLEQNRADFLVRPEQKVKVNRYLEAQKLNHTVLVMDVQRRVDALKVDPSLWNEETLRIGHRLNWKEYPTLRVIGEYFDYLKENFPSICTVTNIGRTSEGRQIKMVKISDGNPKNKALLITAGIHAREWIGVTSALYVLDKVVTKFDHLPSYMKSMDWLIIPVLNPDGYEYTHTHDRLWRKNRRKLENCRGVDINRNFDIDFDIAGLTNKDECYEGYAGPQAFSEAESKALRDVFSSMRKKPLAMIDLHSYGQLILYPWSARTAPTPDRRLLWTSAKIISESIFNNTGINYKYGATYHMIYPATGVAIDWMYYSGVMLSFGIELEDEGGHGFLLPPEHIEPSGKNVLIAVKELLKSLDPELMNRRGFNTWF